jgi:hypothetical protein
MRRTSHTTKKNHPRRKKILGLTPASVLEDMMKEAKHGRKVRSVRSKDGKQKGSLLLDPRPANTPEIGTRRVSPTLAGNYSLGHTGGVNEKVPHRPRETGSQLSVILKRMLGESPPPALLTEIQGVEEAGTNAEVLAAVIMSQAIAGKQWAVELVRDQTEGKPQRAAQEGNAPKETEDFLDRVGKNHLNEIAKRK